MNRDLPGKTQMPETVLCLRVTLGCEEEYVIDRIDDEERVFLFESLDDVFLYKDELQKQTRIVAEVKRVRVTEIARPFPTAWYKPALADREMITLRSDS